MYYANETEKQNNINYNKKKKKQERNNQMRRQQAIEIIKSSFFINKKLKQLWYIGLGLKKTFKIHDYMPTIRLFFEFVKSSEAQRQ